MAVIHNLFFGFLILQIYVHAAPNDVGKLEEIAKVETAGEKLDPVKEAEDNASSIQTVREKRYYNPYGYGFPPISPVAYPNFNKRDDFGYTGNFGVEDPLAQIHRQVQEIANYVRQPQPPRIPHVPIFYPILFVPPFDCNCTPNNNNNYQPTEPPVTTLNDDRISEPTEQPINQSSDDPNNPRTPGDDQNEKVDVTIRWPEMDDERQNWGLVINRTDENGNPNQEQPEFSRPISFDPIRLNSPNIRPPPPVEHGTIQSEMTTTQAPSRPQNSRPQPPNARPRPSTTRPPFNTRPPLPQRPQNTYPVAPPTACDAAIITCCHRPYVVYDCFAIQGCPNITSYGNPCETNSILRIIDRLQQFYAGRSG